MFNETWQLDRHHTA